MSYCFDPDEMETLRSVVKEIQRSLGGGIMKIKDMQTLPEFFGVYQGNHIWIEGNLFVVEGNRLRSDFDYLSAKIDSQALVGCLTGQLEWSKHEPMTAEEKKILREIATWFPWWSKINLDGDAVIRFHDNTFMNYPFGSPFSVEGMSISKAYEILAPILEKYGEINLEEYRESN